MYCKFFGLSQAPFNNTPDPKFFFNTPQHEEALASLRYTAEQRKGFILVTGEVGSGKTLLGRLLLQQLGTRARSAYLSNSALSPQELLVTICRELDIPSDREATLTELRHTLQEYLLDQYAKDRVVVVLLDEAQNLPPESFEELRMLGNLEAHDAKLLQVPILGQTELLDTFRRPEMKQLRQRLIRSLHLGELTLEETTGYIAHRLAVAGGTGKVEFTPEAIERIHTRSGGLPRVINQICDHALLTAYTQSVRRIDAAITQQVIDGMMPSCDPLPEKSGAGLRRSIRLAGSLTDRKHRGRKRLRLTFLKDIENRVADMEYSLAGLHRRGDDALETIRRQSEHLRALTLKDIEERSKHTEQFLIELEKKVEELLARTTRPCRDLRTSTSTDSEERPDHPGHAAAEPNKPVEVILDETTRRSQELRDSILKEMEEQTGRTAQALAALRADAESIIETAERRTRALSESILKELEERTRYAHDALATLRTDTGILFDEVNRRARDLRDSMLGDVEARIDRAEQSLTELNQNLDHVVEAVTCRSRNLWESALSDLTGRIDLAGRSLADLNRDADELIQKVTERTEHLREAALKDAEDRVHRVELAVDEVRERVEEVAAKLEDRAQSIQGSVLTDLEGRLARAEQAVGAIGERVEDMVAAAERKAAELRDQCERLRKIVGHLTDEEKQAQERWQRLADENARADELVSALHQAGQTVSLLGQAQKNADAHSRALRDQMDRAEDLARSVPELVSQLQIAATEARTLIGKMETQGQAMKEQIRAAAVDSQMLSSRLDTQMKAMKVQLQAGQEQTQKMARLLVGLGAMGQALVKAPGLMPTAAFHREEEPSGDTPLRLAPKPTESEHKTDPESPSKPAVVGAPDEDHDVPPLIEFDARRAALAYRISGRLARAR